jgi:hypothetical protein
VPFLTYEATRPWAKAIKVAVLSKKMLPGLPIPSTGTLPTNNSANNGAPEGDANDKPPVTFRDGWNIRPDLILKFPKPFAGAG